MYSAPVIAEAQAKIEAGFASVLPDGVLRRIPVETCHAMDKLLKGIWDPDKQTQTRPFSADEQHFVVNERLLCKVDYAYAAERYLWINYEGQQIAPLYPLWESQRLMMQELARVEEAHWRSGHPDGLLFNILKGRQLGASTWLQSLLGHRVLTHGQVRVLIASDVPQNSGSEGLFGMLELMVERWPWWLKPRVKFHTKNHHLMFTTGSRVIVESGKSMKGGLQDEGGSKGQLGRSKTFSMAHLSEICTWERPEQINASLLPAVPRTPRTLLGRESTALGRNNYWHLEWKLAAEGADPRFFNIFIPWYAEATKYWLPTPANWLPTSDTLAFAKRASEVGPAYMHRPVSLTLEQLYWYELHKANAVAREQLHTFLSEYPSEPEEAFQHSGRSIFTVATIDRVAAQARPIADLWEVALKSELIADRESLLQELRTEQAATVAQSVRARQEAAEAVVMDEGEAAHRPGPSPLAQPAAPLANIR